MTTSAASSVLDGEVVADTSGNRFRLARRSCPVCASETPKVLGLRGSRYQRYGLGVETRLVLCRSCRLVFPDPFPYPLDPKTLYDYPTATSARRTSNEGLPRTASSCATSWNGSAGEASPCST